MYDLTYGLPLKVRDAVIRKYSGAAGSSVQAGGGLAPGAVQPKSDTMMLYYAQEAGKTIENQT